MSAWEEVRCQRDHDKHESQEVDIHLGGPTAYGDYAPVPERLARSFRMKIWRPDLYPVDNGSYCPAHDAVSETLFTHGVWEVRETILTLQVCSTAPPGATMLDFGAQIGWFSLLAASCGLETISYDAELENLVLLLESFALNGWDALPMLMRIDSATPELRPNAVRFAKIDVDGAEDEVVRILRPSLEAGLVDHLLMEVTPLFADYYAQLVVDLIGLGYLAYLLPPKARPPAPLDDPETDLAPYRLPEKPGRIHAIISKWNQEMVWFRRRGASW